MVSRVLIVTAGLLALAACQRPYDPYTGRANTGYSNPSYGSGYGSSAAPGGYGEGCAGGQQATLLHQNRPGGSDYSTIRCHTKGY
ncbi:MAG TPA: hypothetical protein VN681_08665 [Stellaceae bacterium]|nr:hypothetical protein [Stellaceae bacterium]